MQDNRKNHNLKHWWWISGTLLLLAVSFIFDIWGDTRIIREHAPVEYKFYSTDLVREPFADAETTKAGYQFSCNDCHEMMEPPMVAPKMISEHEEIILRHEEAMTCYTCHSRENRNILNDIYGTEVRFEESENICHRCHGPRYRDWKLGIHGRLLGHWSEVKGEATNITCVYCHNPHAPKFQSMKPSPPPKRDNFITRGKEKHHE